jgi:hypothetical protein
MSLGRRIPCKNVPTAHKGAEEKRQGDEGNPGRPENQLFHVHSVLNIQGILKLAELQLKPGEKFTPALMVMQLKTAPHL